MLGQEGIQVHEGAFVQVSPVSFRVIEVREQPQLLPFVRVEDFRAFTPSGDLLRSLLWQISLMSLASRSTQMGNRSFSLYSLGNSPPLERRPP